VTLCNNDLHILVRIYVRALLLQAILSVCLSVCPFVVFTVHTETLQDIQMFIKTYERAMSVVS